LPTFFLCFLSFHFFHLDNQGHPCPILPLGLVHCLLFG
jgi:hypothetical protein